MNTTLKMKIVVPVSAGAGATPAPAQAPARGGSTDPREFLAMRARQKRIQVQVRRWKLGLMAFGCAGMVAAALTMPRWRQQALALTPRPAAVTAVPAISAPLETPPAASDEASAIAAPAVAAPATTAPAPVAAPAVAEAAPASGCDDDFGRHQWRAAVASCTAAFEAAPGAAVAMKLAHSYWSRGEAARAGTWANRAVSMGTEDADAQVLIGHAERDAGHPAAAIAAYRRYLRRAPYGWHAVRVRAAIRELKTELPEEPSSGSN
jgi:hypothetical protein